MSKFQTFLIYLIGFALVTWSCLTHANEWVTINMTPMTSTVAQTEKTTPIPKKQWTSTTKLWLARSCVGEAWFNTVDECIAIAWVYATRAKQQQVSLKSMVRSYSSPLKPEKNNGRTWIFYLSLNGNRPKHWPRNLSWEKHKVKWLALIAALDDWAAGNRPNPVPGANHFGGSMDVPDIRWAKLTAPKNFKNSFYKSTGFGPQ